MRSMESKLNRLSSRKLKRFKRRLRKKYDISVRRMEVKAIVSVMTDTYRGGAREVVSSILKHVKGRSKRRRRRQDNENDGNLTSTAINEEVDDQQAMDVTPLSEDNQAGGALVEHTSITATNRSNIFAPITTGNSIKRDLIIYYGHDRQTGEDPGPEMVDQMTQPGLVPLNDQSKKKENTIRLKGKIKLALKKKSGSILEGVTQSKSALNKVYTETYMVTCDSATVNKEHEVWQAETAHLQDTSEDSVIKCQDIFKHDKEEPIRCVVTKGVAGIGKTVAVQKFILDWADGIENQHLDLLILLSLWDLNVIKHRQCSLHGLLQVLYPVFKDIDIKLYDDLKILLIIDGLDEIHLPLEFQKNIPISDVLESATLDVILTNLITGRLLPNALLWITSRPVAANQIPPESRDRVTEIRGFNDSQKNVYFTRKISDPLMASHIISGLKSTRSLYIMCHVPLFCWIAATVFQDILGKVGPKSRSLSTTLTELYIHYLVNQTIISFKKYDSTHEDGKENTLFCFKDVIFKLGQLAYHNLLIQNVHFTEQDLKDCGISVKDAAKCPGLCTEVVQLEHGLYPKKLYCFIHLSVQEFLAALYAFHEFENRRIDSVKALIKKKNGSTPIDFLYFLKGALDSALDSKNGHLDLFTRFLVGISHDSSRDLLQGLLGETLSSSEHNKKLIGYIKILKRKSLSPERCINLIHCLLELKDPILQNDNQVPSSDTPLTPFQCSFLAFIFMSEKPEEFDFRNKQTSEDGFYRLAPALQSCSTALLNCCHMTPLLCATVASVLRSPNSCITVLDLGHNNLGDVGVRRLCDGLWNANCKVKTLNLSHNNVGEQGVKELCKELCKVLIRPTLKLLTLDLSCNDLGDLGLESLAFALYERCTLQALRLSGCLITLPETVSSVLVIALRSDPFQMKELDLSYNPLGDIELDFPFQLKLNLEHRGESRNKPGLQKYACELTLDPSTANDFLVLSKGDKKVTRQSKKQWYPITQDRFDKCNQVLCKEGLDKRHYLEVECLHNVHIGMAYKGIERKGTGESVTLGCNANSWTLYASKYKGHAQHKDILHRLQLPKIKAQVPYRVGVFLDWPAGTLSFYMVNQLGTMTHLYTFHTTFTEPLYLGFGLNSLTTTVHLL
ncbi:NACHT, LRR and PYD domains-containing protein 3-like [Salvelinus namaycush]|uniref:NACHT, LRR and PYD domains-containing protein 3-like n=1 Tax=Salvelinus namaycush TaxID=8040 RepID=A0A8U0P0Q4_SALNM|nr:NACHT, LRR and PYD domains-containing protein 3-like [Salvelinus namaycush]XP_038816508.1 NACHT, LRR and PYD domains-containing protein 3-like [Salvelinus namaycush]